MPRPKPISPLTITGKNGKYTVYVAYNKVQGRNKYILDLEQLIESESITESDLLIISYSIDGLAFVYKSNKKDKYNIEVIFLTNNEWTDVNNGVKSGDVVRDKIQQYVSSKIASSTSTAVPTTTAVPNPPPNTPFRLWENYYVLPKTGIQIYQEKNIQNVFKFNLPQSKMDEKDIRLFLSWLAVNTLIAGMAQLDGNDWVIEFQFYDTSTFPPKPKPIPLDIQEQEFKKIDNQLIEKHGFTDFMSVYKVVNIDDINNLKPNDIVKVKSKSTPVFNIEIVVKEHTYRVNNYGILGFMRDINEGTIADDIFYPVDWFLDPDFEVEIIKGGASADYVTSVLPKKPDTKLEEELENAKKELSQLLLLKSFTSPIEFERKLQINQMIADVQKKINELNFKILEKRISGDNIFDDLFEQSFSPINNTYSDVYAPQTTGGGETPASANFFSPDGTPSKLSDALNELIRTPQFMEWFGNWQLAYAYRDTDAVDISCSKVVTADFEPLVVWHGTGAQFSYFRFDNFPAAYFAVKYDYSKWFADLHGGGSGYTIPFFLNIRNPLDLSQYETRKITPKEFFDYLYLKTGMTMEELEVNPLFMDARMPPVETWVILRNNAKMLKKIADLKVFDGIHFYETNPSVPQGERAHSTEAYITFSPEQCKVADPERGLLLFASLKSFLLKKGGKI
jgi:hypothetical protein